MYNSILDIDNKNKKLKDLSFIPGFDMRKKYQIINEKLKLNNNMNTGNDVIKEDIFVKIFAKVAQEQNKKQTRKKKDTKEKKNDTKNNGKKRKPKLNLYIKYT
jgi:hypothetical protein